jgi:substrate import-associated zinc metallohydrolase lipoprotein
MFKHKIYLVILALAVFASCKKEDDLGDVSTIPGLGGDSWVATELDTYIRDTFTIPFNVAAKYKWDQGELDFDKTLTPPREEKIKPVLSSIKKVWIDNYVAEAGKTFMQKYIPKFFVLVGSANWNIDGTITLGTAEGGRRIVLYVLNDFRTKGMQGYVPADSTNVLMMFHTIEHEFGHIMHQTIMYPQDFKRISVGSYTSNWNNIDDSTANEKGFISAYAQSAPDEDFVEMLSIMLTKGKAQYEAFLNGIKSADAKAKLRQKETIVVNYLKDVWGINFTSLQTRTRNSINALIY